jgi:hypothetical protein
MSFIVAVPEAGAVPVAGDCTALFCVDINASPVADALKRNQGFQLLRSIYMTVEEAAMSSASLLCSRVKVSEVWVNSSSRVVLVSNCATVPAALARDWFETATKDISVQFALVLDGIYIRHPLAEAQEPALRYVATSMVANSIVGEAVASLQRLEVGQLVTSCSALVMAQYEQTGVAALMLLCHKELSYSVESAKCFEKATTIFSTIFESLTCTPQSAEYSKYISIDPYLMNTGNLYA